MVKLMKTTAGDCGLAMMQIENLFARYDNCTSQCLELIEKKNHDYDEAWRLMCPTSFTDFMLVKSYRIEQIERLGGYLLASEGTAANYEDILNYAVFYLIKIGEEQ